METALGEQMAAMKRELRRWQFLTAVAIGLALVSLVATMSRRTRDEIRAHAFSVVDENGEVVASLGDNRQGGPLLKLHAPRNGGDVLLGALGEDLAGIAIMGREGAHVTLSTVGNGAPSLGLRDNKGRRVILGLTEGDGPPSFQMTDGAGSLAATTSGLRLKDAAGKIVFSSAPEEPAPSAADKQHHPR